MNAPLWEKMPYFRSFWKRPIFGQNVICVEMSIWIAKIPKIPRVTIYMATFEPKLVEKFWLLLSMSIPQKYAGMRSLMLQKILCWCLFATKQLKGQNQGNFEGLIFAVFWSDSCTKFAKGSGIHSTKIFTKYRVGIWNFQ